MALQPPTTTITGNVVFVSTTYNSLPIRGYLYYPTSSTIASSVDTIVLYHGTITGAGITPYSASQTFINIVYNQVNIRDKIIFSVAYPQDAIPAWEENPSLPATQFPGLDYPNFYLGNNITYAEAALLWVKEGQLNAYFTSNNISRSVKNIFTFGHSQGAYLTHRLNTMHRVDGVISNAPGPIDLLTRCSGDQNTINVTCNKIRVSFGSTAENPSAYDDVSLKNFLSGTLSPALFTQALDDTTGNAFGAPQVANMQNIVQAELNTCTNCENITFNYYETGGHDAFVTNTSLQSDIREFVGSSGNDNNPISFSQISNEFGRPPERNLGAYRVSESVGTLSNLPLDTGIPQSGSISFSNFYSKRLNVVVDLYSIADFSTRLVARSRYDNNRVVVIGGFRRRPASSAGSRIIVNTNKIIGSDKSSIDAAALRTGGWEGGTQLEIEIGSSTQIIGSGGNGGRGANSGGSPTAGGFGSSGLGIQYPAIVRNRGYIQAGSGGGGGSVAATQNRRSRTIATRRRSDTAWGGNGGGGGAGIPIGTGGSGGTATGQERRINGAAGRNASNQFTGGSGGSNGSPAGSGGSGGSNGNNGGSGGGTSNGGSQGRAIIIFNDGSGTTITNIGSGSINGPTVFNIDPT